MKKNHLEKIISITDSKPSRLERFGLYYLNLFRRLDSDHSIFDLTDAEINRRVRKITIKGIVLSSLIGLVCVFPTVWVDVHFTDSVWYVHYGWVAAVTLLSIAIEFYILFVIALKAVYEVSELINMHAVKNEFLDESVFSVKHILARTALEVPDPELKILGIDPFKRISKKNLLILGLLYKAKIVVTNTVLKYGLKFTVGNTLLGIPVLYEALPVECFWNSVVIRRVVHEARLRLFGFALANQIANNVVKDHLLHQLSPEAKVGCLRALGNAVVMAQNYHPNMIILMLRFQQVLKITNSYKLDDWNLFLETLKKVTEKERYFLLDLFTVAAAFDGKLSELEKDSLRDAYGKDFDLYHPRLIRLTECLQDGKLNEALSLCKLDFVVG
ncbi:MAG: hypothetical protein JST86_07425 [Bacteroidetes bacterium]|nr:hypothetical protein [Bacteroidota bacterium]